MGANKFIYKSFFADVEKELKKDQRRVLRKVGAVGKKEVKASIVSKGLIDEGDLLKSVGIKAYDNAVIVGAGFPADFIEYGTDERIDPDRKFGGSSGKMTANPFMLPAFRQATAGMQKIMSEEW